jgi:predicted porin
MYDLTQASLLVRLEIYSMNKKIIAIALTTAFAAPLAAHADVTIYGYMSMAVESVNTTGATNGVNAPRQTHVTDQTSRIGFKGTEDLGNGLAAIWQVESQLGNANGGTMLSNGTSAAWGTRNTFVGLSDKTYGTAVMGYYDSAYKRLTTTDVGTDILANTTGGQDQGSYKGITNRGDFRLKNSVHYTSPVVAGFQGGVSYGADEAVIQNHSAQQHWSLAGHYVNGGLIVAAGYDYAANTYLSSGVTSGWSTNNYAQGSNVAFSKISAGYKFTTGTYLGALYEHGNLGKSGGSGANMTQNSYELAVTQDVGARTNIKLSYAKLGGLSNAGTSYSSSDYEAKQWLLAATYALSKTTSLFAYYTQVSNSSAQNANLGQPVFDTSSNYTLNPGSKVSALGAGMTITF